MSDDARGVARVMSVLVQLSAATTPRSNQDLARQLGIPPSSMFRLLRRLMALGYIDFDASVAGYVITDALGELGERLADAGCRSPPVRRLIDQFAGISDHNIVIWVRSGFHVRIAASLPGKLSKVGSCKPGELAAIFSTPGLALALHYSEPQIHELVTQCRRRKIELGRNFRSARDVLKALANCRQQGVVSGFNINGDGAATIAWPIPVPMDADPYRVGAIAVWGGASALRRREGAVIEAAKPLLASYRTTIAVRRARGANN